MSYMMDISDSSYMLGKARARLRHQKRLLQLSAETTDPGRLELGRARVSLMEERLAALHRAHSLLTPEMTET